MPSYGITHESGTLKRVLVHHPGKELKLANSDPVEHHFEQPVDVERFIADHRSLMDAQGLFAFLTVQSLWSKQANAY